MELTTISPDGEVDVLAVGELRTALDAALADGGVHLVVDLSAATFVDSTALAALDECSARFTRAGRLLLVVAPRGSQAAVALTLSGLRHRLHVHPSLLAAKWSLRG